MNYEKAIELAYSGTPVTIPGSGSSVELGSGQLLRRTVQGVGFFRPDEEELQSTAWEALAADAYSEPPVVEVVEHAPWITDLNIVPQAEREAAA